MIKDSLIRFIDAGGSVYQMIDGLIETTDEESSLMLSKAIQEGNFSEISKSEAFEMGFKDLAEWSLSTDALIVVDGTMALCVPSRYIKENTTIN